MRALEIKFMGMQSLGDTMIHVDDTPVKIKKNDFGSLVCNYETNKNKVNIKVFRMLDVGGIFWFLSQLFFFVISIFGIFDVHHKQRCWVIDFEIDVDLQEQNNITLQIASPQDGKPAVKIETDLTYQEISNKYVVDHKAKKTLKALLISKVILAVAILALAASLLVSVIF